MVVAHHDDCDGFRFEHLGEVRRVSSEGRGMWRAFCARPPCDFEGTLVGPDAHALASREAAAHTCEVPCDGRCLEWSA